ncbi:MAG: hypothetical protein J6O41_07745 [Clostridia bacterium]|nr:hypothetical protein [Clostridia bacterium]
MKRPIIVELSGLPNSGKTTLMQRLITICEEKSVNAEFIQESAELLPLFIKKGSLDQNLWITLETLQRCTEIRSSNTTLIIVDRGFYNQLFWATLYKEKNPEYSKTILNLMNSLSKIFPIKPDYLYVIDVDVQESLKRRMASGEPITFSKESFLINYKTRFAEFYESIEPKFYLDTTNLSKDEVANIVFSKLTTLL